MNSVFTSSNAIALIQPEKRFAFVGDQCEVFDAELSAIHRTLTRMTDLLATTPRRIRRLWLFSDSQAALQRLQHQRYGPGHGMATLIHQQVNMLHYRHRIPVNIHWVPGHTEVSGNETADFLAKTGFKASAIPGDNPPVTLAWIRRQAKATRLELWQSVWNTADKGRSYQGEPRLKLDAPLRHTHRFDSSTIVQLRTGHGYFNSYLSSMKSSARKKIPFPRYNCRAPRQTPEHLLLYCVRFKEERKALRKAVGKLPWRLQTVLYTPVGLAAAIAFIQQTGVAKRPDILRWERESREVD